MKPRTFSSVVVRVRRGEASWALVVVGWLAVQAASREGPREPRAPEPALRVDLNASPPRELRRLPGIGEVKALAIARERWRSRPEPLSERSLEELPGIGPKTAVAVRRALHPAASGADPP